MKKQPSLSFCLVMDAIGCIPFLVPVFGEMFDLVWAPVSAIIFYFSFGRKAIFGAAFNLVEEIVPVLNFTPTFTIAWLWRRYISKPTTIIEIKPA